MSVLAKSSCSISIWIIAGTSRLSVTRWAAISRNASPGVKDGITTQVPPLARMATPGHVPEAWNMPPPTR